MNRPKLIDDGFLALVRQSITLIPTTFSSESNPNSEYNIPSLKGNLHKICFQKKRLKASLKHWINSKIGLAKCVSFETYLKCAEADGHLMKETINNNDKDENHAVEAEGADGGPALPPNRRKLFNADTLHNFDDVNSIHPDTFLNVYHSGILYLGVVADCNEDAGGRTIQADDSPTVLVSAARLYRHLLSKRCGLDPPLEATTEYGFAVSSSSCCGEQGTESGACLVVHKLRMDVPASTGAIGSRAAVQVESNCAPISITETQAALKLMEDLVAFLLTPRPFIIASNNNYCSLPRSSSFLYPGPAMLLSGDLRGSLVQQERRGNVVGETKKESILYQVLPTITGSLVIYCHNLEAVKELVPLDVPTDNATSKNAWFVKCKTPLLYGPFWATSQVAINGTRKRLQLLLEQPKKTHSQRQVTVAKDWLWMHPFDAIHEKHRSVIVVRDMGNVFKGQLDWKGFLVAFGSLLRDTLLFQSLAQLVHGDIHAGNVLLLSRDEPSTTEAEGGNEEERPRPRLALVDWDEAARGKPFHRDAKTDKEKRRYPADLIDFPDLYTRHQLQELFEYYIRTDYYHSEGGEAWKRFQQVRDIATEQGLHASVRGRHKVLCAFLASVANQA